MRLIFEMVGSVDDQVCLHHVPRIGSVKACHALQRCAVIEALMQQGYWHTVLLGVEIMAHGSLDSTGAEEC